MSEQVRRRASRKRLDRAFQGLFLAAIGAAMTSLIILLYTIFSVGLKHLRWEFVTQYASRFYEQSGVLVPLVGSFYVVGLTVAIALPIGIATAIYLEFYAGDNWLTRLLELNIANLAGVPSIVYGLFGLAIFVRFFAFDRSVLSASLTMALLMLPMMVVNTQEALRAVPPSLAHAAYALGASQWQVVSTVIVPAARGNILTGVILAISRVLGETAPLITIGAWAFITYLPKSPLDGFTALPVQIFIWASKPQQGFQEIAATAIILLLMLLLSMNAVAIWLRNKYQRKAEW